MFRSLFARAGMEDVQKHWLPSSWTCVCLYMCICIHVEPTQASNASYVEIGKGYCNTWKYLPEGGYPPLLPESSPLYSADRIQECKNRCLDAYSKDSSYCTTAFYIRTEDQHCACSGKENVCGCSGECNLKGPKKKYTAYATVSQCPCFSLAAGDKWAQRGFCPDRCDGKKRCSKKCAQRCSTGCACNNLDSNCTSLAGGDKWVTKCPRHCHKHGSCHKKCGEKCTGNCTCNNRRLLAHANVTDFLV